MASHVQNTTNATPIVPDLREIGESVGAGVRRLRSRITMGRSGDGAPSASERLTRLLPGPMQRRVAPLIELVGLLKESTQPHVAMSFLPSVGRGFLLRQGRRKTAEMVSGHATFFDWGYKSDRSDLRTLYQRAKAGQWDTDDLDWSIDVDPMRPDVPILPEDFLALDDLPVKLSRHERDKLRADVLAWLLSQFLHGEQGALFAAAQVTESVRWYDGKLYGATQVVDEARHIEAFNRYLDEKLGRLYVINDNLFVIIDALMTDSRWDMKFLGMQIMVEGLALGAFGTLYKMTKEPLLRDVLRMVIQDEARHVHYGVLALGDHIANLSDAERREREDWAFEVALLMRNRFLAHEVYEEWFEGLVSRKRWNELILKSRGMAEFRRVMFRHLVPNLEAIHLYSDRIRKHYIEAGLDGFAGGKNATEIDGASMVAELDGALAPA